MQIRIMRGYRVDQILPEFKVIGSTAQSKPHGAQIALLDIILGGPLGHRGGNRIPRERKGHPSDNP